ncbi:MAG TPA: hypothetical protein VMD56_03310 [Steroidobacteraceae bacterium]|nr:hypothetical protein [Steroidobacteraceae bacterium]
MCASQHDAGEQRQPPEPPQPHALSPPSAPAPAPPAAPAPAPPAAPAPAPPAATPPQLTQAGTRGSASGGVYATRRLDASLIVIGAALFLCALATLSSTWAWSWHAGSDRTFSLLHMHGICTSAMGELAQGASGTVASHCLWVDGTWTEAVALTGGGCIVAVIGVARTVRALRTPT